ncbi:response regulator [Corallococcus exiguus]|uniref:response regulator n=1 Tax=Corallococcus TaxID=83461 RepID=UPI000EA30469|nr:MULTISPECIES: response regulator [Corallococcus]RKI39564.1 response regulator [Corallococcus sp. AB004]NNC18020.1 response regulator [Corallococcus exiguus]NPC70157.1 response regulator [Corallococcus exiguus]NPD26843.1 response regulator [Corallococcus exiguus]NRD47436.1 response regulator [Corallococcus exiguus]
MKRLLIVDDEFAIVEALEDILSLEGYDIVTAYNGDEGLQRLMTSKPDLVLLDLMMPVMDGGELLRRIRAHPDLCDLPVVVMSAGRLTDEERRASSHFLAKPFELDDLLGTIAKQLPADGALA